MVIAGTLQGNVTGLDDKSLLSGLAPGKYNVQISFIGYKKVIVENLEIIADQVKSIEIGITEESFLLDKEESIIISAKAIQDSESAMLTFRKKTLNCWMLFLQKNF